MEPEQKASGGPAAGGGEHPQPDINALAEKVYRLMLADLRLDVARAGRGPRKG